MNTSRPQNTEEEWSANTCMSDSDHPGISFVHLLFSLVNDLEEAALNCHQVPTADYVRTGSVGNN